jgi:polysaccharide biosynthesis/export protein
MVLAGKLLKVLNMVVTDKWLCMNKWLCLFLLCFSFFAHAEQKSKQEYLIGAGDVIRIVVYSNPDLTTETRVTVAGAITFPLLGEVKVAGDSVATAEKKIAKLLERGGYIKDPQVNITVTQYQSQSISILGDVMKPGKYVLDQSMNLAEALALAGGSNGNGSELVSIIKEKDGGTVKKEYDLRDLFKNGDQASNPSISSGDIIYISSREVSVLGQVGRPGKYSIVGNVRTITDFISQAGGIAPSGGDKVVVVTKRNGEIIRTEIDVDLLYKEGNLSTNFELANGDSIYVPRYPVFYIYGEVQRSGAFRLERNMTLSQALATGGGLTPRGTEHNVRVKRRDANGTVQIITANEGDILQPNDVVFVREGLF